MTEKHFNYRVGRLIIVDDEVELLTVLSEILTGQGYETVGFTSGTKALEALKEQDYDLLLTDMMMPEMDGIDLLRAALDIDPDIIGIVMTGQGTVQTAVEAMKTGAFDYILKPFSLNALLPVLSRAMEVHRLRLENLQLRETIAMHELGKAIAFSTDLDSILTKVTDAVLQQCDADEASIMLPTQDGKELHVVAVSGGSSAHLGTRMPIDQGIAGWVAQNHELVALHGEVNDPRFAPIKPRADIRAAVSMPMLAGGNMVGVLNVNITHSRRPFTLGQIKALSLLVNIVAPILENTRLYSQIRQAEEKYRNIFENAVEGMFQSTPDGTYITVNPAFASMFGYAAPQEMMAEVSSIQEQLYANPEDRTKMQYLIEAEGVVKGFEVRRCRKNGSHFWTSLNARAVRDERGNIQYYEGMIEDITDRKDAERRQKLVNEILEALNRPNEIVNLIHNILLLLKEHTGVEAVGVRIRKDDDFPYYETNGFPEHFLETEKYLCARDDAGEIICDSQGIPYLECMCGNVISERTDPALPFFTEGGSFWTNSTTKFLASTTEEDRQARTRNRCNREGYESVALIPLRSGDETIGLLQLNDSREGCFTKEMIRFLEGIGASISIALRRLQAAQDIRKSEEKYRLVVDNAAEAIIITQDEKLVFVNRATKDIMGYSEDILTSRPFIEFIYPDDRNMVIGYHIKRLKGEEVPIVYDFRVVCQDGTVKWIEQNGVVIEWEGKRATLNLLSDITERRRAEDELHDSEEKYRSLASTADLMFLVDRDCRYLFMNEKYAERFDLPTEKFIGRPYGDLHSEEITKTFSHIVGTVIRTGESSQHEYKSDMDGKYFLQTYSPVKDREGKAITAVTVFSKDITDRKQAEKANRLHSQRFIEVLDSLDALVYVIDMKTYEILLINKYGQNIWGEIEGKICWQTIQEGKTGPCKFCTNEQLIGSDGKPTEGVVWEFQNTVNKHWYDCRDKAIYWPDGRIVRMEIATDITERKQAEDDLQESEEKYRAFFETSRDCVFITSKDGRWIDFNDGAVHFFGYESGDELKKVTIQNLYHNEQDRKRHTQEITQQGFSQDYAVDLRKKDGSIVHTLITSVTKKDKSGEVIGYQGTIKDVTDKRKAEESLKASQDLLRSVVESAPIRVFWKDTELRYLGCNSVFAQDAGLSRPEDVIGKDDYQMSWREQAELYRADDKRVMDSNTPKLGFEEPQTTSDGHTIWLRTSKVPLHDADGRVFGMLGIYDDITARRQAEDTLKASEEKYRLVVENAIETIFILQEGKLIFVNPGTVKLLGYSREVLTSKSFFEFIYPDDRKLAMDRYIKRMSGEAVPDINYFRFVSANGTVRWIEIHTVMITWEGKPATLNFVDDITEHKDMEDERQQNYERLKKALGGTVLAIASLVETKDPYTAGHQRRVAGLAHSIATEMNLSADQIDGLHTASTIHDIGKISVPAEILSWPGKLSDIQFSLIKTHAQSGYDILKDIEFPWPIARIVLEHHERMNGSGYPHGLTGDKLLLESRILMVADTVEAMASHRPYRPGLGIDVALDEITKNKGVHYDPEVVDACLKLFKEHRHTLLAA